MPAPNADSYRSRGGILIHRLIEEIPVAGAIEPVLDALDSHRGVLLASSYEYPGRYTRWDMGFVNPSIALATCGRDFRLSALNERGRVLLPAIAAAVRRLPAVAWTEMRQDEVVGTIQTASGRFPEEQRSKQPSVFSLLRALLDLFFSPADPHLGLYGAFGYDLAFQFEPLRLRLERPAGQRDLVLYLPDEIIVVDHRRERAARRRYDFEVDGRSTQGLPRDGAAHPYEGVDRAEHACDHLPGEYAANVRLAREAFRRGDLFEVVPGQTFFEPCPALPSELFRCLRERNPAPYGFLINLGQAEYLVGASPEMYVRVEGDRVETCPISGTIARGGDPISDAAQILQLLNSSKDESELTMCTDVDRNDKSRICQPGSVRVIGHRQIELYSRLIHTVDHVEGHLREEFDALDAFLAHAWAVTVTGAPKAWAMQFIEDHEKSPRAWYGGAIGFLGFDGNLNTGLTLRTIRIQEGVAQVRAGATLLYDSDPEEEERETRLKAAALIDAIRRPRGVPLEPPRGSARPGEGNRILLVDHQDSFVHTLANYLRQTGAEVVTLRAGFPAEEMDRLRPDLIVLSPGPGRPSDFDLSGTLAAAIARELPVFGVCLGLQGMVEHFGGELGVLSYPMHGKDSRIRVLGGRIFIGLPDEFTAGRYHSLFAVRETLPPVLRVTAESEDGVIMAIEHASLPLAAVQFHPESILTLEEDLGLRLIRNVVACLGRAENHSCG
ncbi:MAG: anthranilate synthase [Candidatus Tectomicrobia bacterium]|uniref:Anthranilate synthase n=1 Tax=Tectimicrobiota bacterium TaxID=2528274 RepID=A0A932FXL8_UNCTE|nr:anthranilate synthase [Candidatus Tectomicrobia bacterium]